MNPCIVMLIIYMSINACMYVCIVYIHIIHYLIKNTLKKRGKKSQQRKKTFCRFLKIKMVISDIFYFRRLLLDSDRK